MNAINKRLLSWLCVIAMVLSLVPVMDLSGFAIETKAVEYGTANWAGLDAATTKIMNDGNTLDDSDPAIEAHIIAGTCPMCGAEGITWTAGTGTLHGANSHRYYTGEVTMTAAMAYNSVAANAGTYCIALKGDAKVNTGANLAFYTKYDTINVMGTGTITGARGAASADLIQIAGGTVNLYGGNFRSQNAPTDYRFGVVRFSSGGGTLNIWDGATIGPETKDTTKVALNIMEHASGATINMYGGTIQNGVSPAAGISGNVSLNNNNTFNMYGGTIKDGAFLSTATNPHGANVLAGTYSSGSASGALTGGTFNMYGGTVSGGTAYSGANVATNTAGSAIKMYGGYIKDGVATQFGANVYVPTGSFTMYGGTVQDGACTYGPNVCTNGGTATISGGTVSGGKGTQGGSIRSQAGTVTINGTALITGGKATGFGGNLCTASSGIIKINGGKIANGEAPTGGNIYANSSSSANSTVQITDGVISGGVATSSNGGNILVNSSNVTISGGTIEDGEAVVGGNIFVNGKPLSITGGTIKNGIATTAASNGGGNIFVTGAGSLTIDGATIEGGKAILGGNIYASGAVTVKSGTIKNGEASLEKNGGGNIYANCALTISGGTISGGKATSETGYGGNIYNVSGKTVTITGGIIEKGEAAYGGNVHVAGTLNLNGGSIADGTAAIKRGGNVNVGSTGTMNVAGGTVTGGTAPVGGSIYVYKGTLNVTSGSVTGGNATDTTADFDSDNVFVFTGSEATLGISSDVTAGFSTTGSSNAATLSGQDVYVQLNGTSDVAITGNGTGTVYGMDAANDDYDATKCGTLTVTDMTVAAEAENSGNNYRYISLPNGDGTWGFHRVDLRLTHVTLRTTHPDAPKYNGIYYKSILYADDTVGKAVASYGVAVDLTGMPDENFIENEIPHTAINGPITFGDTHAVTMNSGAINNIVQSSNTAAENASNLAREIYANPYVAITRGSSTYNMMGNQDVSYSLHDVLDAINTGWTDYTAEQQTMVKTNLAHWVDWFEAGALSVYNNIF